MGKTLIAHAAALAASLLAVATAQAAPTSLFVHVGPPAPVYEVTPAYRHGHVWVEGHWQWDGWRHHWVPGHYIAARPGYDYRSPRWVQQAGGWGYAPGAWVQVGHPHDHGHRRGWRRDRDRDGVPDWRDRDGGTMRDRDQDGVPDWRDRRPNNPYRY